MRTARIAALYTYPIKSCAGIATDVMRFDAMGPVDDRRWMLIDQHDSFITQREVPRLALVRPARVGGGLRVLAPDMPALSISGTGGERCTTWCWDDRCAGFDEGPEAAAWFSEFIGRAARLVRFDGTVPREADRHWVGAAAGRAGALTRFSDGYPLLVISSASLAELDRRLADADLPAAAAQRFRPNVVFDGLDPFEEDLVDTFAVGGQSQTGSAAVSGAQAGRVATVLKVVKPCTRCTIPEVDPATGRHEAGILQVLGLFRSDPRLGGAVTFGQNCIVTEGLEGVIRVNDSVSVAHRF